MHATPFFASDGRRSAKLIGPRFGPAAQTRKHRSGVALVIAHHLGRYRRIFFRTAPRSLFSSMIDIGAISAWDTAGGEAAAVFSGVFSRGVWFCMTLVTTACAPSRAVYGASGCSSKNSNLPQAFWR